MQNKQLRSLWYYRGAKIAKYQIGGTCGMYGYDNKRCNQDLNINAEAKHRFGDRKQYQHNNNNQTYYFLFHYIKQIRGRLIPCSGRNISTCSTLPLRLLS